MNKFIVILIAVAVAGGLQTPVFAQTSTSQTSTSSLQALIDSLKQQIATLQAKIQTAQQAQQQVEQAAQDVKGTLKLISGLREGVSGEQVRLLQTILAGDPSVYPEGKITGYFGALTAKAVKRFQKKFGLEQVGQVGSKTLEKLNKWLGDNPLAEEDSDKPGEGKRPCAIVPPGHLIAPGWLRKQDGEKPIVPTCQVLPLGILQKLGLATTTPDVTAPVISGIAATSTTAASTHITWTTNEPATSRVWYSTSTPVQATSTTPSVYSGSLVLNHDLALSGLVASTTYYYVVSSADAYGNSATTDQFSFTTTAQ